MSQAERYGRFEAMYAASEPPPWDSGIVPPEVIALIEGEQPSPGLALDVGCGTGTNALYLAQQGWQVTGVDWIPEAVKRARSKADRAGLNVAQLRFAQVSVISRDFLAAHPPVDLWLDIGCLHGLEPDEQHRYAGHVRRLVAPGGRLLIYAWLPPESPESDGPPGLAIARFADWLGPDFALLETVTGAEATNTTIASAWHSLRRT
jgi:SAM-dependent methyltransferase